MAKKARADSPKPKKPAAPKKTSAESKAVKPRTKAAPKAARSKAAPAKKQGAKKPASATPATLISETVVAEVVVAKPLAERFADFDAAKDATIDALLEIIEMAEMRLCEVKRVQTFDELEPLANGHL